MQRSQHIMQHLYLIVPSIPSHLHKTTDTPAQRVIVPICRWDGSATHH